MENGQSQAVRLVGKSILYHTLSSYFSVMFIDTIPFSVIYPFFSKYHSNFHKQQCSQNEKLFIFSSKDIVFKNELGRNPH